MLEFKSKSLVYIAIICALVVSVFSASGKDTIPCHVEHDYKITQAEGECKEASQERTLTFTLKQEMIGLCKGPNQYNTTTSCECSEFDFIEESTPCQNGLRTIRYKKLFNCINGYQPKEELDQPCECTENDIGTFYDECVNGNISVIPYYKTNCRGGVELPPIKSFPCDLTCPNGFYLAPPASECQICPNGTYHFSEGIRYTKWDTWPDHFATNCSGSGCHFWRLKDDHIDSGDQSKVKTSATSLLEHRVEIVREPAYVSFSYKLESNELSEFGFYVDSKEELFDVDDSTDFQNKTILLSKGVHILKWYFYYGIEDSSRQQKSSGLVTIKNLEITGTQFLHHECEKCPPGHFSHSGQAACTPCPVNTHSDKWGQSTCHKCDDAHYALEGYSKCLKRPVCTKKDIVEKYGACKENGKREITYSYIEPKICVDGVALPAAKEDYCARCEPGMIQTSKNSPCTPCPDGTALIDDECVACSAGSAAVKKLQFIYLEDNNGKLPKQFTTSCIGACGGQGGWQVANDEAVGPHLTSGTGHGKSVNVQLALDVNLYTQGSVKFEFQFENYHLAEADDILLSVYVDEQQIVSLGVDDMKNQEQRIALSKGEHRIVWAFQKYSTESQEYSDPAAILKNIIIVGESSGSADTCSPCRAGYKCPEGAIEYSPCMAGSFSTGSQTSCQKCPAGTFTDRIAQSTCILCGNGTYPNEDSTTCINECRFADPSNANITFDLTSLKSETFGPFSANDTDADLYFGICQVVSKKTCNDRADRSHEYGCAVERKYAESIGNMISFTPKTDQDGLDILLTRAAFCWDDNDEKQEIKTEISMLCDPNAGHGKPELQKHYLSENSNCTNTFTWTSSLACRECTTADYEGIEGVCNNGTRKVSYFWKKDIRPCSGGVELPDDQVYECPACGANDYTSVAGECVNGHRKIAHFWKQPQNCTVNAAIFDLPKDLVVECTDYTISHSAAYFGAFVISTALIALLSGLVFLYIRHMKLYRSYSLLTNKGKNKEMNNVVVRAGDDDTDDERHDNVSESEAHTDPSDTDSDHDFLSEKRKIDEGSNVVTANKTNNVMLSGIEDSHSESEGLNNSNTNNNNQVGGVSFHEFT